MNLSTKHRNVFVKLQIKYFSKIATEGSTEARKLEKEKKLFVEVYRSGKSSNNTSAKT